MGCGRAGKIEIENNWIEKKTYEMHINLSTLRAHKGTRLEHHSRQSEMTDTQPLGHSRPWHSEGRPFKGHLKT